MPYITIIAVIVNANGLERVFVKFECTLNSAVKTLLSKRLIADTFWKGSVSQKPLAEHVQTKVNIPLLGSGSEWHTFVNIPYILLAVMVGTLSLLEEESTRGYQDLYKCIFLSIIYAISVIFRRRRPLGKNVLYLLYLLLILLRLLVCCNCEFWLPFNSVFSIRLHDTRFQGSRFSQVC